MLLHRFYLCHDMFNTVKNTIYHMCYWFILHSNLLFFWSNDIKSLFFFYGVDCMLITCRKCGHIHERNYDCKPHKPTRTKEITNASKFRSKRVWTDKAKEIKKRDLYLCQYCIIEPITSRYNFRSLEVHHIFPIAANWDKRLDNYNLITLCSTHHRMADNKEIDKEILLNIARENEDNKRLIENKEDNKD